MRFRVAVAMGLASMLSLLVLASPASAGHGEISLPIEAVVRAPEGDVVLLGSVDVDEELVGRTCSWEFHALNSRSVHPGNDLILATGGAEWLIENVELVAFDDLVVTGSFQLGETVSVSLRMGPDEVFSEGVTVEVVCEDDHGDHGDEAPTTTAAPTTTEAPATSAPPTTGDVPTTTTEPQGEVSDRGPATTTPQGQVSDNGPGGDTLPQTGTTFPVEWMIVVVAALLGCGVSLMALAHES